MKAQVGVSKIKCSQPKCIKLKMRRCKLRSGLYWHKAIKQKSIKQVGLKAESTCVQLHIVMHITYEQGTIARWGLC
jgi:hypothetical protein